MKRIVVAAVCILLAVLTTAPTHAAGKDKGMEPKICKRGKLIFEDDFSGGELDWVTVSGNWKVVKEALVTQSAGRARIDRPYAPAKNLILEFRVIVPPATLFAFVMRPEGPDSPAARINTKTAAMELLVRGTRVPAHPFSCTPSQWVCVLFEIVDGQRVLTVAGKTIRHKSDVAKPAQKSVLQIGCVKDNNDMLAIDDLKIWEALPLDAPDYKEEKTAGEAKEEKPDEAKPAEAEKPKEEKAPVELGNALGKDAAGNPIAWDFSDKGIMRSTDAGGNLTRVTLYGPGQMTTRMKVQTLVLMGKGEVEITAGGKSHTVKLPGEAKINSEGFITLKAAKGTVQITDVKVE